MKAIITSLTLIIISIQLWAMPIEIPKIVSGYNYYKSDHFLESCDSTATVRCSLDYVNNDIVFYTTRPLCRYFSVRAQLSFDSTITHKRYNDREFNPWIYTGRSEVRVRVLFDDSEAKVKIYSYDYQIPVGTAITVLPPKSDDPIYTASDSVVYIKKPFLPRQYSSDNSQLSLSIDYENRKLFIHRSGNSSQIHRYTIAIKDNQSDSISFHGSISSNNTGYPLTFHDLSNRLSRSLKTSDSADISITTYTEEEYHADEEAKRAEQRRKSAERKKRARENAIVTITPYWIVFIIVFLFMLWVLHRDRFITDELEKELFPEIQRKQFSLLGLLVLMLTATPYFLLLNNYMNYKHIWTFLEKPHGSEFFLAQAVALLLTILAKVKESMHHKRTVALFLLLQLLAYGVIGFLYIMAIASI